MKKLNLFKIKRDEERAELVIEKSQASIPIIRNIIGEATKGEVVVWKLFNTDDENYKDIDERIEDCTDTYKSLKSKDYKLDIFIGKRRIILVVRASIKNQQKFINIFMKFCKWKKKNKIFKLEKKKV